MTQFTGFLIDIAKDLMVVLLMPSRISNKTAHNSSDERGLGLVVRKTRFMWSHRCLIGLRSGLTAGHSSTLTPLT